MIVLKTDVQGKLEHLQVGCVYQCLVILCTQWGEAEMGHMKAGSSLQDKVAYTSSKECNR